MQALEASVEQFKVFVEGNVDPLLVDTIDGTGCSAYGAVYGIVPVDEIRFNLYDDLAVPDTDVFDDPVGLDVDEDKRYHELNFRWRGDVVSSVYTVTNLRTGRAVVWHAIGTEMSYEVEDDSSATGLLTGAVASARELLASPNFQPVD